jgi:hypothetical protein
MNRDARTVYATIQGQLQQNEKSARLAGKKRGRS